MGRISEMSINETDHRILLLRDIVYCTLDRIYTCHGQWWSRLSSLVSGLLTLMKFRL
jgi:hypothetical protein